MNKRLEVLSLKVKAFFVQKLFKINDTPQRVAIGFGLGVFTGIFPGAGPLAALFLAFVFRANRASALIGSLLTNTWLSVVTSLLAIKTGSAIFKVDWQTVRAGFSSSVGNWQWQVFLPVISGYIIIALALGIIAYIAALLILKWRKR
ncbi:MAG: DUF2062 domain-containing protein [Candidatus Omnitrophota bacterium]